MNATPFTVAPLALAAALALASPVQAASYTWACTDSYWDYADCWSPIGLPASADDVLVAAFGGFNTVLRYDDVTDLQHVNQLTVSSASGAASVTFEQSGGSLQSTNLTITGNSGQAIYRQTGGQHTVSSSLVIDSPLGVASYELRDGLLQTKTSFIGLSHTGAFVQTGGRHISNEMLLTGYGSNYSLQGGMLQTGAQASIGSRAVFEHGAGAANLPALYVGRADGAGTYSMLSADSTAVLNANLIQVAYGGFFNQGGASTVVTQVLRVGDGSGESRYTLQSGILVATSGVVGGSTYGKFSLGQGTAQFADLVIGEQASGNGTFSMSGGDLTTVRTVVGQQGTALFQHAAGTHTVNDTLSIGSGGVYALSESGRLQATAGAGVINHGSFSQTGGRFVGTLVNHGQFLLDDQSDGGVLGDAPEFAGHLVNYGNVSITGDTTFGDGVRNEAYLDLLPTGRTLTLNGQGLANKGNFVLTGGALQGSGAIVNLGDMSGHGRVAGWEIDNFGTVAQRDGTLALAPSSGAVLNYGRWELQTGRELRLDGTAVVFDNLGSLALAGGRVGGRGQLLNRGLISGNGNITSRFHNSGTLAIGVGEQVTVIGGFANDGQIDLRGGSAALSAGPLLNQGLVLGQGRVMAAIDNQTSGRIVAQGGLLTLGDTVSNAGLLGAEAGGTLLLQRALASQTGTLQLAGGSIDTNGQHLRNDGIITGWGTLRATTLDNAGRMLFGAGNTQVFGSVENLSGAQIVVSGTGVAHFHGTVQARAGSEIRVSADSAAVFFGAVSQASGAAFTGDGTRYFEGGLSVGNSPGAGGSRGNVVFGSGNLYRAEIGGVTAGSGFDHFTVTDHLSFGGTLQLSWWGGFEAQAGQRFDLFDWGSVSGQFTAIDFRAASLADGLRWDTSKLYSSGEVGISAVPEPATWALMLAGMAAVGVGVSRSSRNVRPGPSG